MPEVETTALTPEKLSDLGGMTSAKARAQRLATELAASKGRYELPDLMPCVIQGVAQWAASTAYAVSDFVAVHARIYRATRAGTSGSTAPSGTGANITDGTVRWAAVGYMAPVAAAASLALVKGQIFASNGLMYQVSSAGSLHASDPLPSDPAGGTHGTVNYVYVGRQELPIVSMSTSGAAGLSAQLPWNDSRLEPVGGTRAQVGANPRFGIVSASYDGVDYDSADGGGGSLMLQTDAPVYELQTYYRDLGSYHWVDGKFLAFVYSQSNATSRYLKIDSSGLARKLRDFRHLLGPLFQIISVNGTSADTFRRWTGSRLKVVWQGDSFCENPWQYSSLVGIALGVEDWRIAGEGGTGLYNPNASPARVNYADRFDIDVIDQDPDLVVIQLSQNDATFTSWDVNDIAERLGDLVGRVRTETNASVVVIGVPNYISTLASNPLLIDQACEVSCEQLSVPYIPWRDLVNAHNSAMLVKSDNTHPSIPYGDSFRASYILPRLLEALNAAA